ncbi:MAG: NAD(P)-binding domain-containing protein, partial [Pseudonocardiaceae bacterium]
MPNECEFLNFVNERKAVIAIIGLGNTGLPVAQGYVDRGFPVRGVDINAARVDELRGGRSYLSYLSDQEIQTLMGGSFLIGTDFCAVADADVVIVCVPTPLGTDGDADLSSVHTAFDAIAPYANRGVLV